MSLADRFKVTVLDLIFMNPDINKTCDNLPAGNWYCAGVLGSDGNPNPQTPGGPPVSICLSYGDGWMEGKMV